MVERNGRSCTDPFAISSCSSECLSFEGGLAWLRLDDEGVKSVAIIGGSKLSYTEGNLDIELDRPATLCITRRQSGGYEVLADLENLPDLNVRLNASWLVLQPGLPVTTDWTDSPIPESTAM